MNVLTAHRVNIDEISMVCERHGVSRYAVIYLVTIYIVK